MKCMLKNYGILMCLVFGHWFKKEKQTIAGCGRDR